MIKLLIKKEHPLLLIYIIHKQQHIELLELQQLKIIVNLQFQ